MQASATKSGVLPQRSDPMGGIPCSGIFLRGRFMILTPYKSGQEGGGPE